ncbi:hypothetical protein [Knoellia flava]|uniref:Uncharacterized protein n=2 Tax=Knoellia flava TaxID=913969 RepID=A0A8H9KR60_9MICO|nr:hypothetical protein [Knoellia flava]GGB78760.1 hypothetical protein GCM10011314_17930 [Knoellia flava]
MTDSLRPAYGPWGKARVRVRQAFGKGGLLGAGPRVRWAQPGVTGLFWLVIPLVVGLFLVRRNEVK